MTVFILLSPVVISEKNIHADHYDQSYFISLRNVEELPKTCRLLEVGKGDWIHTYDDLRLGEESYLELDPFKYKEVSRFDASAISTRNVLSARTCTESDGTYLVGYIKEETTPQQSLAYMLAVSTDKGVSWDHIEVDRFNGVTEGSLEILVHEEKVFYSIIDQSGQLPADMMVRVTPLLNCWNISTVDFEPISITGDVDQTKMIGVTERMLLFAKRSGLSSPSYFIYSNGTWSQERFLPRSMGSFSAVRTESGTGFDINILFFDTANPTSVRQIISTDRGTSWSSPNTVAYSDFVMDQLVACSSDGMVHGAVDFAAGNDLGVFTTDGTSMSAVNKISTISTNGLDPVEGEFVISSSGDDVIVHFENGNGIITRARSMDCGRTYSLENIGAGQVHSPSVSDDLDIALIMNGTEIQVGFFERAEEGRMRTNVLTVPALSSWDQMGLSLGGVQSEGSFEFKVLSSAGDRVYPETGMVSVHSSPNGTLGGNHYQHIADLSGLNDPDPSESYIFEFYFSSSSQEYPVLFSILFNYTISYPHTIEILDDLDLFAMRDVRVTSLGMELVGGSTDGYGIFGPFQIEDRMPHHIWAEGKFLSMEDYCTFSVHYLNLSLIPGYSSDLSDVLESEEGLVPINWERRTLNDLSGTVDEFYIKVNIHRTGTLSPRLTKLKLGYSTPPVIDEMVLEEIEILRTQETLLHISASDEEEPSKHLRLDVELMLPGSDSWTRDGISDPFWNGEDWEVRISTHISSLVGNYSFRAIAADSTGEEGDPVRIETPLLIKNNVPLPPLVSVFPESPLTGDIISMSMVLPGEDIETSEEMLKYNVYAYLEGEIAVYLDNLTTPDTSIEDTVLEKGEDWEVHVTTWDGIEESEPFRAVFEVGNTGPALIAPSAPLSIYEDEVGVSFDPEDWFMDADEDLLSFELNGPPDISPELSSEGKIILNPREDINGDFWLWVKATDGELNATANLTVVVEPVNDDPEWKKPDDPSVLEGETLLVDIGAVDDRDGEDVKVILLTEVPGMEEGVNRFSFPNGSFYFTPDNSMVGTHSIRFSISDGTVTLEDSFNLTVMNVNRGPTSPGIILEPDQHIIVEGESINAIASSQDEDIPWGDSLQFSWTSSLDGELGSGEEVTLSPSIGLHEITVTVTDSEGASNSTVFSLEVLEEASGGGSVMRTWLLYTIAGVVPLLIGLLIGLLLAYLMVGKKRKDEEEKEEEGGAAEGKEPPGPPSEGPVSGSTTAEPSKLPGTQEVKRELPPAQHPISQPSTTTGPHHGQTQSQYQQSQINPSPPGYVHDNQGIGQKGGN
jgi:hypothetical protein